MTTSITYPNGQVLVSTALSPDQMNKIIQPLTCGMIGINPPDYSKVRVAWQQQGQPFQNANDDICYIACSTQDDEYSRVRDRTFSGGNAQANPPVPVTETWVYTRVWKVTWFFYGPNSNDHARAAWSGLFLDYANDVLAGSKLYVVTDPPAPGRLPQEINGQWVEYADLHCELYEEVTETVQDGVAVSVETKVETNDGQVADITVTA